MNTLERVKIRLGIPLSETKDDLLLLLKIDDAQGYFKDYCNRSDVPEQANSLIEQMVVSLHEFRGGVQSEKIGDTSFSYFESMISDDLKRQLNRYRRIRML